jgi:hypothetical protein
MCALVKSGFASGVMLSGLRLLRSEEILTPLYICLELVVGVGVGGPISGQVIISDGWGKVLSNQPKPRRLPICTPTPVPIPTPTHTTRAHSVCE